MRIAVSIAAIALLVGSLPTAVASAQASDRERAIDLALDYEPLQDAVSGYEDIHGEAWFNEQENVWQVEVLFGDREIAWATVSLEEGRVLEFGTVEMEPGPESEGEGESAPVQSSEEARAIDLALDYEPLQDAVRGYEDVRAEATFSEQKNLWHVELISEDREIAWATVSLEENRVLEFGVVGLQAELQGNDEERDDDERSWWRPLVPQADGTSALLSYLLGALFLATFWDFSKPLTLRNLDLVLVVLWIPGLLLVWNNTKVAYLMIFIATLATMARLIAYRWLPQQSGERINLPLPALRGLLLAVAALHVGAIAVGGVDDSGIWGLRGGRFFLEEGYLPYGKFGDGDTYGPLEYMMFVPVAAILPPGDDFSPGSHQGARVMAVIADLALIAGLWAVGRRLWSERVGTALAFAYAVLPYAFGSLPHFSHILPAALMVWAFYWLSSPVASGLLLAAGATTMLYPAFAFPLWWAWFRQRGQAWPFVFGFAVLSLAMLGLVFLGESSFRLFFDNTLLSQEGSGGYGSSHFGFWGQFQSLAFLMRPVLVLYLGSCLLLALWPRRLGLHDFIHLTATVVLGTQLWKTHAGGTYMGWFVPFLVLAFLVPLRSDPTGQKTMPEVERAESAQQL